MLRGGSLICATTAWGWIQINNGKLLSEFPFARFCDYIGVKVTDNFANCPSPIEFREELIKFKNVHHVVKDLTQNPDNVDNLAIIGSAVKELGDTLPGVPLETLQNIVMNASDDVIPVNTCPVRHKNQRDQSSGLCGIMCGLPGIKAPGINEPSNGRVVHGWHFLGVRHFPGDFDRPPQILTNAQCHVESKASEWYCTGLFSSRPKCSRK